MDLAEVQAHIKTMTLKQFVIRRLKEAFSAFGNIYEFRSVNGSKWYPINRLNMMFPKLDPDVSSYVRQLFDRLNQGEEVTVQAKYSQRHMKGKLLIVPQLRLEQNGVRSNPLRSAKMSQGQDFAHISPASSSVLLQTEAKLAGLIRAAHVCLEEGRFDG